MKFIYIKRFMVSCLVFCIINNVIFSRESSRSMFLLAGRDNGGGLHVASIRNRTNPLGAVGSILQFSPVEPKEKPVKLSTDMNVKFTSMLISDSSTVWRSLIPQRYLVTVAGVEGNPGRETLGNWFKIDKYEDAYKRVCSCPGVCNIYRPFCGDIGILGENGKRVLFVGRDQPLKGTFHKL
ncbi:kunitz trypsin inhibitor 5-like [Capsicum annuum]